MTHEPSMSPLEPTLGGDAGSCCHQWLISKAAGPTSEGICQLCGETKDFKNSITANHWKPGQGRPFRKSGNDSPPLP